MNSVTAGNSASSPRSTIIEGSLPSEESSMKKEKNVIDTSTKVQSEDTRDEAPTPSPEAEQNGTEYPQGGNGLDASPPLNQGHLIHSGSQGYFMNYVIGPDGTPSSPAVPGTAISYDAATGTFVQQGGTFAHTSSFIPNNSTHLSPPRTSASNIGMSIPPASPLFPRINSAEGSMSHIIPQSPNISYVSPGIGTYASAARAGSSEEGNWDSR